MNKEDSIRIFEMARDHLLSFEEINEEILNRHLTLWKKQNPTSMKDLLKEMISSITNKQGMPNTIGDIENLRPFLFEFTPALITKNYGDDWQKLFRTIQNEYAPPSRMDIHNKRSYWVRFCQSILSASSFLSRFSNMKDFNNFVSQFYLNEYTRVALPLLLSREVYGLGFALACDFLKENGYPKFVKPDTHLKAIFTGIGISKSKDDYEIFKDIIRFSEAIEKIPYEVDKLFWLVGSGRFYLKTKKNPNGIKIIPQREAFIKKVKNDIIKR